MQFNDFPLDHRILKALEIKGFQEVTEIQAKAIGQGLLGKDLLASSKTGSGKTLAFLIPALQRVLKQRALSRKDPRVLILAPTRELAKQVFMQLKWLIANQNIFATLILGGENFNDQVKALKRNPQFVVGTAGRVADHVKGKSLYLNGLELLILDEADRMLDLGFAEELKLIDRCADHRKRQTMMFSATLDSAELHYLTERMLNAPQRISVGDSREQHLDIEQQFYLADHLDHKISLLKKLLENTDNKQVIVFTATREDTEKLSLLLAADGIDSAALSASLTQSQRSNIMNAFSRGQHQVLVTTDVASRGLDLRKVEWVINFDLPKLADEYIHRIGRTGRAGSKGNAASLVGPKDWQSFITIKGILQQSISFSELEGLEGKFKGLKPLKQRALKGAPQKKAKKVAPQNAPKPQKRIRAQEGVDVGHIPMRKKARPVEPEDE
ncbi:DEAD/DEAH box helicase [Aliiglaciecola sp. 2_MG-2023]|uniref:DEAD/DEAH box helicase n=1 Tax=Alteromonadaceae TaxID=72275 RepID=UPI0026E2C6A8|nr:MULTISPECIES: DEAD/DEAH box helicase [unclassified Aliiglaciecola]MDO6712177.1 DEAD/DEAH box helicase [Aliiglaciecola sp. 2_MG-2023]MDO6753585.1 DEAD/DEAH box helicase [Aliiglaciecola sp. 1_MG-2023]